MIPKYFFSLFESVQRIEEYLGIKFDEIGLDPEEIQSLNELSKQVLVVTPRKTDDLQKIKSISVTNQDPCHDLDINQVRLVSWFIMGVVIIDLQTWLGFDRVVFELAIRLENKKYASSRMYLGTVGF